MICEVCGCTDERACVEIPSGRPCHWTRPGLCSACDEIGGPGLAIRSWPLPEVEDSPMPAESAAESERSPKMPNNDPIPFDANIGQKYDPAMVIRDQAEADAYFERLVEHTMRVAGVEREEAERIERANLGYYAGYSSHETRLRVESLFRCEHPVFGSAGTFGRWRNEQIAEMGRAEAEMRENE